MKYITAFTVLIVIPLVFLTAESHDLTKKILPHIILESDDGSYADGRIWDSSVLQGKITLLVYFDPDERKKGEIFMPTLEAFERDLDFSQFQTILIVNLKATLIPGFLIKTVIKGQAKDHPKRNYIFDDNSVLVKNWRLGDDEYNTLVTNEAGRVIYSHSGKWKEGEISIMDSLIRSLVRRN
ncbi:MAG: YtfJ family protein [Spirochaetota bacterium]|nr:YtfJ family protein [Spirochaetota bacterium]